MKTHFFICIALVSALTAPCGAPAAEPVDLGSAGDFAILAGSAITSTGGGTVNGNVGLSPETGAKITGLTAEKVNGIIYTVDGDGPDGAVEGKALLKTAKYDLATAYSNTAALTADHTVATELGGTTYAPGVYDSEDGTFDITGILTLDGGGDPDAVFIFKMESTLTTAAENSEVILINRAQASNVFWQVGSSATLGVESIFKGIIMAHASVTMNTDSVIEGRILARDGQVTFNSQSLDEPTLAVISAVRSRIEDEVAVISWDVELEIDTVGYYLERWADGAWLRINDELIDSRFWEFPPVTYEQADPGAPLGTTQRYRIVELDGYGRLLTYGPYELELDGGEISYETWAAGIDWGDADSSRDADPDGDGLTNWQEYLAGTDPLSANSVLRVTRVEPDADGLAITWSSEPVRVYAIEMATAPNGPFTAVATGIPAEAPANRYVVPVDPAAVKSAFFRVVVE